MLGELDLELVRLCVAPEGAFGVLMIPGGLPLGLWTIERTYALDPRYPRGPQYVKVPAGRYRCVRTVYHKAGHETYEITGVVGHSRLLIHPANVETDLDGCTGVGLRYDVLGGQPAVLDSRAGFWRLMAWANGRPEFWLRVRGIDS